MRFRSLLRDSWLPALVAALGSALAFGGWRFLVAEQQDLTRAMAENVAAHSRAAVGASVRERVVLLRNLAGFWAAVGRRPVDEWRANADILIESFPDLVYLAWIDSLGHGQRVAAGKFESPATVEIEPSDAKKWGTEPSLVGPERDDRGVIGFRVFMPVRRAGTDLGILEARVNVERMLADVLAKSAPGYAVQIRWGDEEIYRRGEPSTDPRHNWWRAAAPVSLPLGMTWTMILAPTPELAAAWLTPVPNYLLAAGILLAIALGVLAHLLAMSLRRGHLLAEGTELLEARVAERTSELEAFNHSISHDLKSPLGAILNFTAIFDEDYRDRLDAEGLDMLARIRGSAIRGTELLDGLLRLSRAGHTALDVTEIDMGALARESFAQVRASDADPDVEFILEPLPNARGDRGLVREVLVNLFDNALKYTRGREKRRVTIGGRTDGIECMYEVSDNGPGFDMRYADKLFSLFERLHASREIQGTGVGLAIVARIVRRLGGRVWAEGKPGGGARFAFTLPRGRAAS